jgi:CheY-like chemotaxis protein
LPTTNIALIQPPERTQSLGRLLVIEPDASRALALRKILHQCDGIEFEIVKSVSDALGRLDQQIPDVVLTPTFLPPSDEAPLTARLNQTQAAAHVQVINLPYFIDSGACAVPNSPSGGLLSLIRREASARPRCDAQTLKQQIEQYVTKARSIELELSERQSNQALCLVRGGLTQSSGMQLTGDTAVFSGARSLMSPDAPPLMSDTSLVHAGRSIPGTAADRRRARRRRAGELSWLQDVKLPGMSQVRLIDISSGGILFETKSRLFTGTRFDLQLVGENTSMCVQARMLRNQVAGVDGGGVRYQVAAAFAREVDLLEMQPSAAVATSPRALGTLLSRVLGRLDQGRGASGLRATFEQEFRGLLSAREIQIRHSPRVSGPDQESIYFTVPTGAGSQPILQATFERNHTPTALQLQLLKAAAIMAAVVLEFEPFDEVDHHDARQAKSLPVAEKLM